jgi:hypothetical protein
MKKFILTAIVFAGFGLLALSDYEVKIVKAEAAACNLPSCD